MNSEGSGEQRVGQKPLDMRWASAVSDRVQHSNRPKQDSQLKEKELACAHADRSCLWHEKQAQSVGSPLVDPWKIPSQLQR